MLQEYLSSKIVKLQTEESKLSEQIKATSDALGRRTTNPILKLPLIENPT